MTARPKLRSSWNSSKNRMKIKYDVPSSDIDSLIKMIEDVNGGSSETLKKEVED